MPLRSEVEIINGQSSGVSQFPSFQMKVNSYALGAYVGLEYLTGNFCTILNSHPMRPMETVIKLNEELLQVSVDALLNRNHPQR